MSFKIVSAVKENSCIFNNYFDVDTIVLLIEQTKEETLPEITLQSDVCWLFYQELEVTTQNTELIKNIKNMIKPISQSKFDEFDALINNENKQNLENNMKQVTEKENRINVCSGLITNILKLSAFDKNIENLKVTLLPSLYDYQDLLIDEIDLEKQDYEQIIKFISSIRIDEATRQPLCSIFRFH